MCVGEALPGTGTVTGTSHTSCRRHDGIGRLQRGTKKERYYYLLIVRIFIARIS